GPSLASLELSSDPATTDHVGEGPDQDLDIRPQRPVGAVEVVELDHLGERRALGTQHLPRAGHTGRELKPPAVTTGDALVLFGHQRPGTDEAHLAAPDVDQLR